MSNFKPGDKAIYVGPIIDPDCIGAISYGDEVTLLRFYGQFYHLKNCWVVDRKSHSGKTMLLSECDLRKPDAYDITAQDWYQRILRGERLEETA